MNEIGQSGAQSEKKESGRTRSAGEHHIFIHEIGDSCSASCAAAAAARGPAAAAHADQKKKRRKER